tara:strand:+ start:276 stop:458 length:183 start_codon:yes stop_codon:yes gene_type:complete
MSKLNNRYPKKDKSKLLDGSTISAEYNPKTKNSPRAWEKSLNQEKYKALICEESNIPVYK